jgi:alcohol dehydrogenase (NADP+)
MSLVNSYAVQNATTPLAPFKINRRTPGEEDVQIDILYCGVCHSDIHQARSEWGPSIYPMVPGHEIVGRVMSVGSKVSKFKAGDLVGVGCFVDSCRTCPSCQAGEEQYCDNGMSATYNGYEKDKKTPTYGGYSTQIVVDHNYVLKVSEKLPLHAVAPLLCAGITTYSPLRKWNVKKGDKIGIIGLGGLGHMGVKFGVAMGADVTVLSHSPSKEADAKAMGAHNFLISKDADAMKKYAGYFDFLLNTVSAFNDYNEYLNLLKVDGTMVLVGAPPVPVPVSGFSLIGRRRSLAGSLIGGIRETQEMLDFCAEHNIVSEVEVIPISEINEAYERVLKSDVKYRFVIDCSSLKNN